MLGPISGFKGHQLTPPTHEEYHIYLLAGLFNPSKQVIGAS